MSHPTIMPPDFQAVDLRGYHLHQAAARQRRLRLIRRFLPLAALPLGLALIVPLWSALTAGRLPPPATVARELRLWHCSAAEAACTRFSVLEPPADLTPVTLAEDPGAPLTYGHVRLWIDAQGRTRAAGGVFQYMDRVHGPADVNPSLAAFLARYVAPVEEVLDGPRELVSQTPSATHRLMTDRTDPGGDRRVYQTTRRLAGLDIQIVWREMHDFYWANPDPHPLVSVELIVSR